MERSFFAHAVPTPRQTTEQTIPETTKRKKKKGKREKTKPIIQFQRHPNWQLPITLP